MADSAALDAALAYAGCGYRVFPCKPDKTPLVRWKDAATTDAAQISHWWRTWPGAMIGLPTGDGLAVVDLDVDKATGETIGEVTAEQLGLAQAIATGLQVATPSGGRHAWFKGDLPLSAGKIGRGIDTRGIGGYAIVPGSANDRGAYRWIGLGLCETSPPALPAEITAALHRATAPAPRPAIDLVTHEGGAPASIPEVEEILSWIDPDAGGYQQWCNVLMGLHDHFGASQTGLELAERWSQRGPTYRPGEVQAKWRSFSPGGGITFATLCKLARQNGADLSTIARRHRCAREPRSRAAECRRTQDPESEAEPMASAPMHFLDYTAMRSMPTPDWLVQGVLQERTAALLFGKSNTFKSFLAIDLALSVATGRSWHGTEVGSGKVLYIATEGANGVGRIRIPGWYEARGVPEGDRGNAFLWPREVCLDSEAQVDDLIKSLNASIYGEGFSLVVADIFGGTMFGSETKDETARAWVAGVQGLIRESGVAVLTVAHTGWADETRARMHTHFWGSFDTRLKAEGDKKALQTVLSVDRHKDADSMGTWGFEMRTALGPDGVETLVPELSDAVDIKPRKRVSGKTLVALQALDDALAQYGTRRTMEGLPSCKVVSMCDWRKMCDLPCALGEREGGRQAAGLQSGPLKAPGPRPGALLRRFCMENDQRTRDRCHGP